MNIYLCLFADKVMGKVHGSNPEGLEGEPTDDAGKLPPPVVKSREGTPQENRQEEDSGTQDPAASDTQGKVSPVVNGRAADGQDAVDAAHVDQQAEREEENQPQRHQTPKLQNGVTATAKRTPTPKLDKLKTERSDSESPKSDRGQKTFTVDSEKSKTPERKSSTPVAEVEQNERKEQKVVAEKSQSQKSDTLSQPEGDGDTGTLDSNQTEKDAPVGQEGVVSGDTTNQTDRPMSVKKSHEQSLDGVAENDKCIGSGSSQKERASAVASDDIPAAGGDANVGEENRIGSGSSRKEKQASPVASGSVPAEVGGDTKVIPKEPEGKEKELCDAIRSYIRQLKQMKSYDTTETLDLVKAISQSYWKGTDHRAAIAQVLSEDGFPGKKTCFP
jgi:hypothetical protein